MVSAAGRHSESTFLAVAVEDENGVRGYGEATAAFQSVVACMKRSPDTHQMGRIVMVGGCEVKIDDGANLGNLDIRAA